VPRNLTIVAGYLLAAVPVCAGVLDSQVHPAQEPAGGQYVLKAESPLVVLDVVVTDNKGQPVHGLNASDFIVLERNQKMTLQSFEEYRADHAPSPARRESRQALGPNVFTNVDTRSDGPLNILLMDALNTPMADQMYLREQMLEYVKKVPEGTRIAIFGLTNRLYVLQGFTTDPAVLKADVQMFRAKKVSLPPDLRLPYTLAAIQDLARYLSGLPGRKNLIWFSGSFTGRIVRDMNQEDRLGAAADFADDEKRTAILLTRSRVAVYPIDARGLFTNPDMSAAVAGPPGFGPNNPPFVPFVNSERHFYDQRASDKFAMKMLAEETGGKAFYDTNGLKEALQEAINDGSNYYTLAYVPTNRQWDGRYRSVHVKLDQPGVNLFYRRGYLAYDPNDSRAHREKALPMSVMDSAMQFGGPGPTQILFMAKIVPTAGTENTLPPTNQPNVKKREMRSPYRHYTVWYGTDLKNVAFTVTPDGVHHGSLEFEILLYNPDGELMNAVREMVKAKLPAAQYESKLQSGLEFHQNIDAPAKGEYFLRIGVRDLSSDRVGSVEVPIAAIPPASALP
jgi:VWFA-related protein